MSKSIILFFLITLKTNYPKHELSLGFLSLSVPFSEFSEVANPGPGFDILYRIYINPHLLFNFITGYSYFIPKNQNNNQIIPFQIGAEYIVLGYEKTFSPYLKINTGLSNLKTNYSSSSTKFSFRFDTGFYISLLDFNFSYNKILTEKIKTDYFNFALRYRIPINE